MSTGNPSGAVSHSPAVRPIIYPIRGLPPPSTIPSAFSGNPYYRVTSETSLPSQYSGSHYSYQDFQQQIEFPLINQMKISSNEANENDKKLKQTAILRLLVNPTLITLMFVGKGLDIGSRQVLMDFFLHQTTQQNVPKSKEEWDQVTIYNECYVKVSTCPILTADSDYLTFQTYGLQLDPASDSKLTKESISLAHFLPDTIRFDEKAGCASHQASLVLKNQLGLALLCVESVHVLLRNPYIFIHTFTYIAEALRDPSHDLCKDVYTVPALVWFFSILLAKFYREVKYYHGLGSPKFFRNMLIEKVIHPFLHLQESVATRHAIFCLGETPKERERPNTRGSAAKPIKVETSSDAATVTDGTPVQKQVAKSPVVVPKTVCKYWLAEYLQVPWPNSTNVPTCTNTSPCVICPHQDFASFSKPDLLIFVNKCRHEFHKQATWAVMHDLCLEAVGNMA